MLQFSKNPDRGKCAFADRYQFRLEVGWRKVPGPPDFERMMSDYLARLRDREKMADASRRRLAGWEGIEGSAEGARSSRYGRFFAGESCLVEAVLLWPDVPDERLQKTVLDAIAEEPPRPAGLRRWKAFGMDLLASGDLPLAICRVEPAAARLTFRSEGRNAPEEKFIRLGMVPLWMKGTVRDWLRAQAPAGASSVEQASRECRGHAIEALRAASAAEGLARLRGRRRRYEAEAWICPADGRLYFASREAVESGGRRPVPLAGRTLSCCGPMREESAVA